MVYYRHQLDGLADEEIAAVTPTRRGKKGSVTAGSLTLTNTTQQPPLLSLRDRQTRRISLPPAGRAISKVMSMIRRLVLRLAAIRAQQAELLGAAGLRQLGADRSNEPPLGGGINFYVPDRAELRGRGLNESWLTSSR